MVRSIRGSRYAWKVQMRQNGVRYSGDRIKKGGHLFKAKAADENIAFLKSKEYARTMRMMGKPIPTNIRKIKVKIG